MHQHKRILITGGSRGIGQAIATRFAQEGYQVGILSRSPATLERALQEARDRGEHWVGASVDMENLAAIGPTIKAVVESLGGSLDVLVNNAGIFDMAPIEKVSLAMWQRFLTINLTGPFLVTQAALAALRKSSQGHIINISSVAGLQGFPDNTAYSTTKYGLRGFSDSLREELAPDGISVSTVYPGATDTEIFDQVAGDWDRDSMNKREDVADVVWQAVQASTPKPDWPVPPRKPA